jgi:hypothetical protein
MGSYSGFLLLEDLFDNLPDDSMALYNEGNQLFNPTVSVVEDDCGTSLGEKLSIDFTSMGNWDLALDRRLTRSDVEFFLSQGEYTRFVRNPPHCISPGGVCRKCYEAVNPSNPNVQVGSSVTLKSYLVVSTQLVVLSEANNSFVLDTAGSDITRISYYYNDVYSANYTLTELSTGEYQLTMGDTPAAGDTAFVRMFKDTSSPYMSYLSSTYAGSILGSAALVTGALPARASLLKERITESRLQSLANALVAYSKYIPVTYIEYIDKIKDPLERELYILALYGVFYDVGV